MLRVSVIGHTYMKRPPSKYIPPAAAGPHAHVLFRRWYKRPRARLRSKTSRSLQPQVVLKNVSHGVEIKCPPADGCLCYVWCRRAPVWFMGVSCPAGMCSWFIFDVSGNIWVLMFPLQRRGLECRSSKHPRAAPHFVVCVFLTTAGEVRSFIPESVGVSV